MIGEVQLHTEGKHHLPIIVLGAGNLRYSIGKMMPISYCKVKFSFCFLQNLPKM